MIIILWIDDHNASARFSRLKEVYSDPMTEVYMLFYQSTLQLFVNFNKFLQREDPIICIMLEQMYKFLKCLFGKFINVSVIKESQHDLTSLNYNSRQNQVQGMHLQ